MKKQIISLVALVLMLFAFAAPVLAGYKEDGGNGGIWRESSVAVRYYGPANYYATVAGVMSEWNSIKADKAPSLTVSNYGDVACPSSRVQSVLQICITDTGYSSPDAAAQTFLSPNDKHRLGNAGVVIRIKTTSTGIPAGSNSYLVRHELMHAMTGVKDCPDGPANCRPDSTVQGQFPGFGTWDTGYMDWVYDRWDCKNPGNNGC